MSAPRLIEVALPIREISAESVRDKSLRHGHISTLHLWFARRPLAASRAVVFASLVYDPDHPDCPADFRAAVERHLKSDVPDVLKSYRRGRQTHLDPDPYCPYEGQPDTLRNRLMMFIAKWSPEWLAFDSGQSTTEPKPERLLDDRSLVKWETSGPTIKVGTREMPNDVGRKVLWIARELVRIANGGEVPTVLDPFAGGGAIPLEAGRIGAQPIANDYNPVAYLILRATCEFPQKYGKPGMRKPAGSLAEVEVPNVLAYDVARYAQEILRRAKEKIGHLYPVGSDGLPVVGYLWARTAPCSNTSCRAEIPLLSSLLICNKDDKKVALTMKVEGKEVKFGIAKGQAITRTQGTMLSRGNCRCPICEQPTPVADLRQAGKDKKLGERLVAIIVDAPNGKDYRVPEPSDFAAAEKAAALAANVERPTEPILPEITQRGEDEGDVANSTGIRVHLYGFARWGDLFNARQLLAMHSLISGLHEVLRDGRAHKMDGGYHEALACNLGLWISRTSARFVSFGRWDATRETFQSPFDMAKLSMVWDYSEANIFSETGGGAAGQIEWITRVIEHESWPTGMRGTPAQVVNGDGAHLPLDPTSVDCIVTDPPYFDAISYADISDMFYVWLKRAIADEIPAPFRTPTTPKTEEATALKHRHGGDEETAERHFSNKLAACFADARQKCKPDGVITVIFAHQTTKAWTALVNALFEAGLNITATLALDMELKNRARGLDSSALESSITVVCRPRVAAPPAAFTDVRRDIERVVKESVKRFWDYGFRGADLIVACYGPAVGEFGKHERVERGDGTPVTVPELLQLVREAALKGIAGEFTGDRLSRLYFVWANLYGVAEQAFDDMRLVVQVGGDAEEALDVARGRGLFMVDGPTCRLALLADRLDRPHLGDSDDDPLIDQLHRAMLHWQRGDRPALVQYLHTHDLADHAGYWRLAQALFEVLPRDTDDWKLASALLAERPTLRTEIKLREAALTPDHERTLFDET
jgi:putative DNA methylase